MWYWLFMTCLAIAGGVLVFLTLKDANASDRGPYLPDGTGGGTEPIDGPDEIGDYPEVPR